MRWRLESILEISLSGDWQAVALRNGTALVRTEDLVAAGSVEQVGALQLFASHVSRVEQLSASQQIEQLMARRVGRGRLEPFLHDTTGVVLQAFVWTDGVADVLSLFARMPDESVVELQTSRAWLPEGSSVNLREASEPLLRAVRWLAPVASSAIWSVWRQDDNGNRARISTGHSHEEADAICRTFEARGHKQLYWAAPEEDAD